MLVILQLLCTLSTTIIGLVQVPLPRSELFDPSSDFICFDGSHSIPFAYVNDDYCDCNDGSDEPGTSACPNGTFYCENVGYVSQTIPSSRVNDGYCDCCDASDEYLTGKCLYKCDIIGFKANQSREMKDQLFVLGNQIRLQLAATGNQIKMKRELAIIELEKKRLKHKEVLREKEYQKNIIERQKLNLLNPKSAESSIEEQKEEEEKKVANNIFSAVDANHDNMLQPQEILQRAVFDENKDGMVSKEEFEYFFDSNEDISRYIFYETAWKKLKQLYLFDKIDFMRSKRELSDYIWESDSERAQGMYDAGKKEIIQKSKEACSDYEAAKDVLESLEQEIASLKNALSKDYGQDNEFAILEGECFKYFDQNFHYRICPFNKISQSYSVNGPETILGTWAGWLDKDYKTMLYDKGEFCWKEYQRTVKVIVSCGLTNEVVRVMEPTKCEYIFELISPAACKTPNTNYIHDEL